MSKATDLEALAMKFLPPTAETPVESATKTMVNGDIIFTISDGPIVIEELMSVCVSADDATASTLQYSFIPTVGSEKTLSGASATLASATAGTTAALTPTALTTAPTIVTAANGGAQLNAAQNNKIIVGPGSIKLVIGVGPTTGTWKHYMRYGRMSPNSKVA